MSELLDETTLTAMLSAEAALARAAAKVGLIPSEDVPAIEAACQADRFDVAQLAREAAEHASPVVPLVRRLRSMAGPSVHFGATSQDILDTAAMLIARSALDAMLISLGGAAAAAVALARDHRDTPMAGRTLLQQATPITFGLKAARWVIALGEATDRLEAVRRKGLAVQLGGPTGTLAAYGERGIPLVKAFAAELDLVAPLMPWHTDRTRIADLAAALGTASGTLGKIARDVTLLAQHEVAEVAEAAPGSSSAMPHKRNPVAAVSALAAATQAPGLVATLLACMVQEHERAAGAWQAEWRPLRELLACTGSAAASVHACLDGLTVNPAALAANLAHLIDVSGVDGGVGLAGALVDRALRAHSRSGGLSYQVDGPAGAPVLVLGSSLGTTAEMWTPQLNALCERFQVVRYDHLGHGASPVPPGPYRIDQLGRELLELLDWLKLERVHIGGLSLGGMVAMWVAANAPERVDRLVLLCTSAKLGPPEMWRQRAETVREGGTEAIADVMVGRWFTPGFATARPDVVDWGRKMLTGTPDEGYASCCAAIENMDLLPVLDRITAPALVIAGADDPATPPEHARKIAAGIGDARLEIVEGAAHLANVEQPGLVSRLLIDFLGGDR